MTGPVPPVPGGPAAGGPVAGGSAPGGDGPEHLAIRRALPLVVLAVVLGVLMLQVGSRPPVNTSATVVTTTTVPAHHRTAPTTTTTTIPHATVKVQVANGTTAPSAAAFYTARLQTQNWSTLAPEDTTSPYNGTSIVYYASGQMSSAQVIASFLGLPPSNVQPLSSSVPVSSISGVDVLVVLGPDLADKTVGKPVGTTTTT